MAIRGSTLGLYKAVQRNTNTPFKNTTKNSQCFISAAFFPAFITLVVNEIRSITTTYVKRLDHPNEEIGQLHAP